MADIQSSPLELEHMIGFSANHDSSVLYHPTQPNTMLTYTGCLVIIGDITDPHQQEFLHGHSEEITCLSISPSGNLIASGQMSSTRTANSETCIIVWDFRTRRRIFYLNELHDSIAAARYCVKRLAFSPDDRFLAGADDQPKGSKLCVWDMENGTVANASKQPPLSFLCWGAVVASTRKMSRHNHYKLYGASANKVYRFDLEFDVQTMQYKLSSEQIQLPSTGLTRTYHCASMHGGDVFIVAGSSAGELCVFNTDTMVFRACIPVSCGGLLALATFNGPDGPLAYCGCGDGKVKIVGGQDKEWSVVHETTLSGAVRALSLSPDGAELLAGTSEGDIFVLDARTLRTCRGEPQLPLMATHTHPVHCLAFGSSNELFASAAANGVLRLWELSHYTVRCHVMPNKGAHALCLQLASIGVVSGWTDGFIRCHSEGGAPLWEVCNAHREGVSSVALSPRHVCSGGRDGALRLWSLSSRQMVAQFAEHRGSVSTVLLDNSRPEPQQIHSCGEDKTVVSVDLKQERRVVTHKVQEGAFRHMVQLSSEDHELLTCDTAGCVKMWDRDEANAIRMLVTWTEQDEMEGREKRLNHISLSPPLAPGAAGGDFLLVSCASGEIQVWDLTRPSGMPLTTGIAHSDEVMQAGWSPDGRQVVSVGKDSCICVWNFYGVTP